MLELFLQAFYSITMIKNLGLIITIGKKNEIILYKVNGFQKLSDWTNHIPSDINWFCGTTSSYNPKVFDERMF